MLSFDNRGLQTKVNSWIAGTISGNYYRSTLTFCKADDILLKFHLLGEFLTWTFDVNKGGSHDHFTNIRTLVSKKVRRKLPHSQSRPLLSCLECKPAPTFIPNAMNQPAQQQVLFNYRRSLCTSSDCFLGALACAEDDIVVVHKHKISCHTWRGQILDSNCRYRAFRTIVFWTGLSFARSTRAHSSPCGHITEKASDVGSSSQRTADECRGATKPPPDRDAEVGLCEKVSNIEANNTLFDSALNLIALLENFKKIFEVFRSWKPSR